MELLLSVSVHVRGSGVGIVAAAWAALRLMSMTHMYRTRATKGTIIVARPTPPPMMPTILSRTLMRPVVLLVDGLERVVKVGVRVVALDGVLRGGEIAVWEVAVGGVVVWVVSAGVVESRVWVVS